MSEYLIHYGVKGQKWGRRNWQNYDGSYTAAGRQHYGIGERRIARSNINKNYSVKQRNRDRSLYGKGGVKRINRSMNKGNSISGARSQEATRIHQARVRATRAGRVGSVIGAYAGWKYGRDIIKDSVVLGGAALHSIFGPGSYSAGEQAANAVYSFLESNTGAMVVSDLLGTYAGLTIGREVGRSIGMHSKGYSSKLYRYAN